MSDNSTKNHKDILSMPAFGKPSKGYKSRPRTPEEYEEGMARLRSILPDLIESIAEENRELADEE